MSNLFSKEIEALEKEAAELIIGCAEKLKEETKKSIQASFPQAKKSFSNGIRVYHKPGASYVRLSPILSSFAERTIILGNPYLWILLPDGEKLGFKRISKNNPWWKLKQKYGSRIWIRNKIVIFGNPKTGRNYAIYKLQKEVVTKPRIPFYKLAEEILE